MNEFGEEIGAGPAEEPEAAEILEHVNKAQEALRLDFAELLQGFQRLAGSVAPLLTKQYADTQARMRALETRIRNRQERPLVTRMANLLADVRRLESADDVKAHVEQAIAEALHDLGYQEMGSPGDQFDPVWHEPVSGSVGKAGIVARVRRRGLACYGDVIIKALVEVEPAPEAEDAEFAATRPAEDALTAETQQGGLST